MYFHSKALQAFWKSQSGTTWFKNHPVLSDPDTWWMFIGLLVILESSDYWYSNIMLFLLRRLTSKSAFRLSSTVTMRIHIVADPFAL